MWRVVCDEILKKIQTECWYELSQAEWGPAEIIFKHSGHRGSVQDLHWCVAVCCGVVWGVAGCCRVLLCVAV